MRENFLTSIKSGWRCKPYKDRSFEYFTVSIIGDFIYGNLSLQLSLCESDLGKSASGPLDVASKNPEDKHAPFEVCVAFVTKNASHAEQLLLTVYVNALRNQFHLLLAAVALCFGCVSIHIVLSKRALFD